jgi:predicted MFS family arabinose efflux permease
VALGYTSPCLSPLATDLQLTTVQSSTFASVINIGAVCSGLLGTRYVEALGRKPCLAITAALYAAGFGAIATCQSYQVLLLGRFLTGVGAGLATVVTPCYIAEISPAHMRGMLASLYQLFCTLGILAAYGLGALLSWRDLAAGTCLLGMSALLVCQMAMPETSPWLAARGRWREAHAWKLHLGLTPASTNTLQAQDVAPETAPVRTNALQAQDAQASTPTPSTLNARNGNEGSQAASPWPERLAVWKTVRRPLTLLACMMTLQQLSGINSILFYSCEILDLAGLGGDAARAAVTIGVAQCLGTLTSLRTVDRLGRRVLLQLSSVGMSLAMAVLAVFFLARDGSALLATSAAAGGSLAVCLNPLLTVLAPPGAAAGALVLFIFAFSLVIFAFSSLPSPAGALVLFIFAFSLGWGPVPWVMVGELLPVQHRPLGTAMSTVLTWGGSWVITQSFLLLVKVPKP